MKNYCCLNGDDLNLNLIDPDLFDIFLGKKCTTLKIVLCSQQLEASN